MLSDELGMKEEILTMTGIVFKHFLELLTYIGLICRFSCIPYTGIPQA